MPKLTSVNYPPWHTNPVGPGWLCRFDKKTGEYVVCSAGYLGANGRGATCDEALKNAEQDYLRRKEVYGCGT